MSALTVLPRFVLVATMLALGPCVKFHVPHDVAHQGQPKTAVIVDPPMLDFGEIPTGETAVRTLRLSNIGDTPAKIITHRGKTALDFPPNSVIESGASVDVPVQMSGGLSPGPLFGKSVTIIVEGQPDINVPLTASVISMVFQEPDALRPDQHPDGRFSLCARDGLPFRILYIAPPVIHGIADASLREHEVIVDWQTVRSVAALSKVMVFLDHPRCQSVMLKMDLPLEWSDQARQRLLQSRQHRP